MKNKTEAVKGMTKEEMKVDVAVQFDNTEAVHDFYLEKNKEYMNLVQDVQVAWLTRFAICESTHGIVGSINCVLLLEHMQENGTSAREELELSYPETFGKLSHTEIDGIITKIGYVETASPKTLLDEVIHRPVY